MPLVDPYDIVPTKSSTTQDWTTFYTALKNKYGQDAADVAMAGAWKERGNNALAAEVENRTGFKLDKSALESLQGAGMSALDTASSAFSFVGNTTKYVMLGGLALVGIATIVLIYKAATATASDIGTVGGVAAKTFVK